MGIFNVRQIVVFLSMGILALVLGFYLGQYRQAQKIAGGPKVLQTISLPDVQGNLRSTDEWRGKPMIINFWATWCPPCREEIPLLIEAQNRYEDQGLQILGIALEQPAPAAKFMLETGFNYPSLASETEAMDIMALYGNSGGLPFTIAVDAKGNIAGKKLGKLSHDSLNNLIAKSLAN
ncbi:MAG: thiol-disulfide isomerase/thioredoxin [Gammaproteobacteria bacterium]|jgi:thiol-disulfide isomerase/thioredoxin